ncbi:Conserved_hypothetical protein [Hexamita inflata]|uniref:Uncharacterized protein n=1 Tax=Hexamita inflata TaxID=28002 RepID=A0AA86QZA3_9EUKA|nr:Conserved hypothetical protein [Hexamita inflata]
MSLQNFSERSSIQLDEEVSGDFSTSFSYQDTNMSISSELLKSSNLPEHIETIISILNRMFVFAKTVETNVIPFVSSLELPNSVDVLNDEELQKNYDQLNIIVQDQMIRENSLQTLKILKERYGSVQYTEIEQLQRNVQKQIQHCQLKIKQTNLEVNDLRNDLKLTQKQISDIQNRLKQFQTGFLSFNYIIDRINNFDSNFRKLFDQISVFLAEIERLDGAKKIENNEQIIEMLKANSSEMNELFIKQLEADTDYQELSIFNHAEIYQQVQNRQVKIDRLITQMEQIIKKQYKNFPEQLQKDIEKLVIRDFALANRMKNSKYLIILQELLEYNNKQETIQNEIEDKTDFAEQQQKEICKIEKYELEKDLNDMMTSIPNVQNIKKLDENIIQQLQQLQGSFSKYKLYMYQNVGCYETYLYMFQTIEDSHSELKQILKQFKLRFGRIKPDENCSVVVQQFLNNIQEMGHKFKLIQKSHSQENHQYKSLSPAQQVDQLFECNYAEAFFAFIDVLKQTLAERQARKHPVIDMKQYVVSTVENQINSVAEVVADVVVETKEAEIEQKEIEQKVDEVDEQQILQEEIEQLEQQKQETDKLLLEHLAINVTRYWVPQALDYNNQQQKAMLKKLFVQFLQGFGCTYTQEDMKRVIQSHLKVDKILLAVQLKNEKNRWVPFPVKNLLEVSERVPKSYKKGSYLRLDFEHKMPIYVNFVNDDFKMRAKTALLTLQKFLRDQRMLYVIVFEDLV